MLLEMAEERAEGHPRRVYDAAASATRSAHARVSNRPRGTHASIARSIAPLAPVELARSGLARRWYGVL